MYELHNAGDTAVGYVIDTMPLDQLRENNYLMTILECLQAKGAIPAGGSAHIEFVFSPLEARKYTVSPSVRGKTTITIMYACVHG